MSPRVKLLLYTGKIPPCFIFALFTKRPKGKFKTGQIELYVMDYVGKLESGQIQEVVNQSWIRIGRK